jgi:hypothetical protein
MSLGVTLLEALEAELVPTALVAVTVKVYGVPLVSPVTVTGELLPVPVMLPGEDVTVYIVTADPPFDPGVKATIACVSPAVALTDVGALGATAFAV